MKKKIVALGLISVLALGLVACTDKEKEEVLDEETAAEDVASEGEVLDCTYDPNDYVTLGDYKNLEVTIPEGDYSYTDEGYNNYMNSNIGNVIGYEKSDETLVTENSIVNVDYVGSIDGVAFDGGSAENQEIDIANNSSTSGSGYIEGFTSGLAGHSVGEEVAYEVTFPDNYGNADLAGKTTVFTFQINYIMKAIDLDNVTDEMIANNYSSYTTVDEYKEGMLTEYKNNLANSLTNAIQSAVISSIMANATINGYPENLVQARLNAYVAKMDEQLSATYGVTFEEYVTKGYGYDYDTFLAETKASFADSVQQQLVFEVIAQKEGLEIDSDDYEKYVSEVCDSYGVTDRTAFFESYTIGNLSGESYFNTIYLADKAMQICVDSAVVNY